MTPDWNHFLSGALAMGYGATALIFRRFGKLTKDPFFNTFSWAFGLLMAGRILFEFVGSSNESLPIAYVIRLIAFCLILWAVLNKNRSPGNGAEKNS
jgi:hypothetical protein